MQEEWRIIEDIPNYSVSNLGRIKNNKSGYILKPSFTDNGYLKAVFTIGSHTNHTRKTISKRIHRLVLMAFKPIENPELYDVNHIDNNRTNNNLENLEWCTRSENLKWKENVDNPNRSSKRIKVEYLNGKIEIYNSLTECAQHFNVCLETIRKYIYHKQITPRRKIQAYFSYID